MNEARTGDEDGLLRVFERFDSNGDGLIDETEFGQVLAGLGWHSEAEVRSLEFAAIDQNADGLVEFAEFVDWWQDHG